MFTLFIYALGFSVAPQFFASIDRTTWTWGLLVVIEVVLIVVLAFLATWLFKLDVGTASGLLAGAATESAMVGTASEAIGRLGLAGAGDADASGERRVGLRAVLHLQPHHHRAVRQSGRTQAAAHRPAQGGTPRVGPARRCRSQPRCGSEPFLPFADQPRLSRDDRRRQDRRRGGIRAWRRRHRRGCPPRRRAGAADRSVPAA